MQELLRRLVKLARRVANKLEDAYIETYGDKKLGERFAKEVNMRKAKNRAKFIVGGVNYIRMKEEQEGGVSLPFYAQVEEAERMFERAQLEGDLDELYNLKGEENE